jgi:hypothetical protein
MELPSVGENPGFVTAPRVVIDPAGVGCSNPIFISGAASRHFLSSVPPDSTLSPADVRSADWEGCGLRKVDSLSLLYSESGQVCIHRSYETSQVPFGCHIWTCLISLDGIKMACRSGRLLQEPPSVS